MTDDQKTDDAVKEVEEKVEAASDAAEEAKEAADEEVEAAQEAKVAAVEAEEKAEEVKTAVIEEKRPETPVKAEKPKTDVKVSKKLESLISDIEKLQVFELADLVKALEDRFGVSAAPAAMATAQAGGAAPAGGEAQASEQTTFNVILAASGPNKISVIKAVRELVQTLGLKEAKDLVDTAPKEVMTGVNKETAQEAKTKLEAAGATVELK
jgi:large subunit ribosomal protein L7/L12